MRVAGLAQQPWQEAERAGDALAQARAILRREAALLETAEIAAQDQELGGERTRRIGAGGRRRLSGQYRSNRDRGGKSNRGHGRAHQGVMAPTRHAGPSFCLSYSTLILDSVGILLWVQSLIEPSYISAFLLPSTCEETNQPIEAQWPVLQKLICLAEVDTPAAA
jgi:hypothetical protein